MRVSFSLHGPAITATDLDAFETRLHHTLPGDYREFLLTSNGGVPEFHVIRNRATGDLGVHLFLGIWPRPNFDIDAERCKMRDRWPARFLSIATDEGGNRFCLCLDSKEFGAVYFWDHEQEAEEGEPPREDNLYHLADSFTEFCNRMEPIDSDVYLAEMQNGGPRADPPSAANGEGASDRKADSE